tara:strand:+ start:1109 stop:1753 length:645 start_codon:yes stop_codon:yes gene_type:complete
MDEDISAINTNTRNEKIKNFFINNKKNIVIIFTLVILLLIGYFAFLEFKKRNQIKISDKFNVSKINYFAGNKSSTETEMVEIIKNKNKTYSPLALYFLIDNNIIESKDKINKLFDILINDINLDSEIKNLIIYKKGLYNSEFETENNLINILNPIINSNSIWKSHALYLLAEYFLSKNEKQKAKEFFEKIVELENVDPKIRLEAQKRIQRDFSD